MYLNLTIILPLAEKELKKSNKKNIVTEIKIWIDEQI